MANDSTLNAFVGYGTAATRAAFTPAPPTPAAGFSPLYVYFETDTTLAWVYTNAWHCISKPEGAFALPGDISPSQITSNQNDYNPTGLSTASTLRLNSDASRDITGLQGGADGRILFVHNVGSFNIVLKDESASSTAGNRFALTADVTLSADSVCILQYDSTSSRWRCLSGGSSGGSFTAASTTEVLTGTDSSKGATPDAIAALWEQGADVASAGTTSLGEGGYFNITGTTTITDIDFATDKAGRTAWVKFAGALTLTHNASTLILPTAANITTAAGDTACFVSEGSDVVRCVAYSRASGYAPTHEWTLITSGTASASANIDLTVDSAAYNEWLLVGSDVVLSGANELALQLGDGGGPTFDTGNNYDFGIEWRYGTTSTGTFSRAFVSATSNMRLATVSSASSASGVSMDFQCTLKYLASGKNMRLIRGDGSYDGAGGLTRTIFDGVHNNAAYTTTALRILPSAGTITSGKFILYGRTR